MALARGPLYLTLSASLCTNFGTRAGAARPACPEEQHRAPQASWHAGTQERRSAGSSQLSPVEVNLHTQCTQSRSSRTICGTMANSRRPPSPQLLEPALNKLTELSKLRSLVAGATLGPEAKHTALWCLDELPKLYAQLFRTDESRFWDAIS